jgi:hypothetical protein
VLHVRDYTMRGMGKDTVPGCAGCATGVVGVVAGPFLNNKTPKQCKKLNEIMIFRYRKGGESASSGKLVREPLQNPVDYGSLSVNAYLNASKRRVDSFNLSMSGSVMATRFHEAQR